MTEHPLYETYKGYNILNILFFQILRTLNLEKIDAKFK